MRFDRSNSPEELKNFVAKADFIFHLAGINRPKNQTEFDTGNRGLTEEIISLITVSGKKIPIVLTSSIQAEFDNPYGKSKKAAEDAVLAWTKNTESKAYVYRLPNVFGKWCRPNYNSVVATFCNNIANGLEITINDPKASLSLVYVDDVVNEFIKTMKGDATPANSDGFYTIPRQFSTTLQELADRLYGFKNIRSTLLVPDLEDVFNKFLYATYTSYFDEQDYGYKLDTKSDERGWLAEVIKSKHAGQIFVSQTKPGFTRGKHWHHTKIEKFLVIDGEAEISFRKLDTIEINTYTVSGKDLKVIDIPVGYVHSLKNIGKTDLITLIWADEIFDPENPDTYFAEV